MNFFFPLHLFWLDFSPPFFVKLYGLVICYEIFFPRSSSNAQSRERKCLASEMYVLEMFSCDKNMSSYCI